MRRPTTAAATLGAALALTVVVSLAGCGAGQRAQTAEMLPRAPGANAATADGTILVRNATVEFPGPEGYTAGDTATVQLTVFNDGTETIRLASLESPAAARVALAGGDLGPAPTDGATATPTPTDGAAGTPTPTPPASSGSDAPDLEVPAGGLVHATVELQGLREALPGTGSVPFVLGFSGGERLELTVPVAPPEEPLPRSPMPLDAEEH